MKSKRCVFGVEQNCLSFPANFDTLSSNFCTSMPEIPQKMFPETLNLLAGGVRNYREAKRSPEKTWQPQLCLCFWLAASAIHLLLNAQSLLSYHWRTNHIICEQKHIICEQKHIICAQNMLFAAKNISCEQKHIMC